MKQDILKMGAVVDEMLVGSIQALQLRDEMLADETIAKDDLVDGYNLVIEQRCLRLLALQQPMAKDLRTIAAGLYIIKDVERMGDYALDIAKAARKMASREPIKQLVLIPKMAEIVQGMLHDSLHAYVNQNVEVVSQVADQDFEVDALYRQVHDKMVALVQEHPEDAQVAIELILVARYQSALRTTSRT
jgi:phosphate transport system protein